MRRLITRGDRTVRRFCDLGAGDGGFAELVLDALPGVDRRAGRLLRADAGRGASSAWPARRAAGRSCAADLVDAAWRDGLPAGERYDAVVSRLAIHHLPDERKRALYGEAFDAARAGRHLPQLGARRDGRPRGGTVRRVLPRAAGRGRAASTSTRAPPRRCCAPTTTRPTTTSCATPRRSATGCARSGSSRSTPTSSCPGSPIFGGAKPKGGD